jgi:hypothetical protein
MKTKAIEPRKTRKDTKKGKREQAKTRQQAGRLFYPVLILLSSFVSFRVFRGSIVFRPPPARMKTKAIHHEKHERTRKKTEE